MTAQVTNPEVQTQCKSWPGCAPIVFHEWLQNVSDWRRRTGADAVVTVSFWNGVNPGRRVPVKEFQARMNELLATYGGEGQGEVTVFGTMYTFTRIKNWTFVNEPDHAVPGNPQQGYTNKNPRQTATEAAQLNQVVVRLYGEGKYHEAVAPAERALALREKALGHNDPAVAQSLNNLAELYQDQGAYAKAEPLYARALDIREKALGPNHTLVAQSLNNLAELYRAQGAYAQAESLYARALAIHEKALGPNHPDVAHSLNNLALLYQDRGAYAKAEPLLARALDVREKALGPHRAKDVQAAFRRWRPGPAGEL